MFLLLKRTLCFACITLVHRHLSNIDCLMAGTACLVCFISTVNDCRKKKKPWKTSTSSGHITNLKQSILETLDIYALVQGWANHRYLREEDC